MTGQTTNRLRSRLDGTGARTVLVRGASAPARPPGTVTVEPGVVAVAGPAERRAPLYVTATATSGRAVRRYQRRDAGVAADRAVELVSDRDSRAAWLCGRDQIRSWWGEAVADLLERRLVAAVRRADARLVVWTGEDDAVSVGDAGEISADGADRSPSDSTDESVDGDGEAVGDRYDVVLDL